MVIGKANENKKEDNMIGKFNLEEENQEVVQEEEDIVDIQVKKGFLIRSRSRSRHRNRSRSNSNSKERRNPHRSSEKRRESSGERKDQAKEKK